MSCMNISLLSEVMQRYNCIVSCGVCLSHGEGETDNVTGSLFVLRFFYSGAQIGLGPSIQRCLLCEAKVMWT